MNHGNGVFTFPLPIENPFEPLKGDSHLVLVINCPMCGLYYVCNNIVVASCGCIYHLFCMAIHLESKTIVCVGATCGKLLSTDCFSTIRIQ
jgi:hypothetical protein